LIVNQHSAGAYPITSTAEDTAADGADFQTFTFERQAITSKGASTTPISLTAAPWLTLHRPTSTIASTHTSHPNLSSPCQPYLQQPGKKETIDTLLAGNDGPMWTNALCNEYGQLAQGFNENTVPGTDTIDFIHQHEVPPDKKVTYDNFICDYHPLKTEPYRVCLTVGGNKLPYNDDAGSPAGSLSPGDQTHYQEQYHLRHRQRCSFSLCQSQGSFPCFSHEESGIYVHQVLQVFPQRYS
jgi:hypothetical protein